jgi:hypothetical protein
LSVPGVAAAPERDPTDPAETEAAAAALLAEALAFAGRNPSPDSAADAEGYSGFTLLRADDASPVREGDSSLGPSHDKPENQFADEDIGAPVVGGSVDTAIASALPADPLDDQDSLAPDEVLPPTFVQEARRRDLWRRPGVRAGLLAGVLMLSALLVVQYALHARHGLAARAPALAGPLRALCQAAGCTVEAPREIEAIVIDSTTFNKLRADAYRLSLTVKNLAAHPVAMPAVELTLTDSQDQPVLRRVLMPADLGARSSVLGPTAEWSGTLGLTVAASGSPARVSGYRVLAFYP